jgi:hypothetical protein
MRDESFLVSGQEEAKDAGGASVASRPRACRESLEQLP